MKLLIISCMIVTTFSLAIAPVAVAEPQESKPADQNKYKFTSAIDNINVPDEVLIYAQMTYQGSAVTKAHETTRGGNKLYQLRVDSDSVPDDYNSIHLVYDKDWNLLEDKKILLPPPKPAPKPEEPVVVEESVEVVEEKVKEPSQNRDEDKPDKDEEDSGEVITPRKEEDNSDEDRTNQD